MKVFLCFFLLALFTSGIAQTGEGGNKETNPDFKKYNDIIKVHLFPIILGYVPVSSEFGLSAEIPTVKNQSFVVGVGYLTKSWIFLFPNSTPGFHNRHFHVDGLRFMSSYRFYFMDSDRQPPGGLYIAPILNYAEAQYYYGSRNPMRDYIQVKKFDFSMLGGLQVLIGSVGLDLYTGLGYKKEVWTEHDNLNTYRYISSPATVVSGFENIKLTIGINFSIAF